MSTSRGQCKLLGALLWDLVVTKMQKTAEAASLPANDRVSALDAGALASADITGPRRDPTQLTADERGEHFKNIAACSRLMRETMAGCPMMIAAFLEFAKERRSSQIPHEPVLQKTLAETRALWSERDTAGWQRRCADKLEQNRDILVKALQELPEVRDDYFAIGRRMEAKFFAAGREGNDIAAIADRRERVVRVKAFEEETLMPLKRFLREAEIMRTVSESREVSRGLMVEANIGLVFKFTREVIRSVDKDPRWEDALQAGLMGLDRAVLGFDPSLGVKFSVYAAPWIKQRVHRALQGDALISVPSYRRKEVTAIRQAEETLTQELGRPPAIDEVAAAAGVTTQAIHEVMPRVGSFSRSDRPGESDGHEIDIPDSRSVSPAASSMQTRGDDLVAAVSRVFAGDDRTQLILKSRFRLDGHEPKTLKELAEEIGMTRERVRQIESAALGTLRDYLTLADASPRQRESVGEGCLKMHERALMRNLFSPDFIPPDDLQISDGGGRAVGAKDVQIAISRLAKRLRELDQGR